MNREDTNDKETRAGVIIRLQFSKNDREKRKTGNDKAGVIMLHQGISINPYVKCVVMSVKVK
jgi:hypothetical protein